MCVRLLDVVTGLHGVVCVGSKDACSKPRTWSMRGVFPNGVGRSVESDPLS